MLSTFSVTGVHWVVVVNSIAQLKISPIWTSLKQATNLLTYCPFGSKMVAEAVLGYVGAHCDSG